MSKNQQVSSKFSTASRQSGVVTAALSGLEAPSAVEVYGRIQILEAAAVTAATTQQAAQAALATAIAQLDDARIHLRLINAACVNICAVRGIVSAEHFTVIDKGDEPGLGRRLEPEIRRVPGYGPGLADALHHLVQHVESAEAAWQRARGNQTTAERELDSAILNLQGVVAQGRAVLATFGIKPARKVTKKKPEASVEKPATSSPQPALVPTAA